tara:strand:- start:14169 stop:14426 length:258 start_codon:yes stop_codon:yes gene_type:complete
MIRQTLLIILSAFVIDVGVVNCYSMHETAKVMVCGSSIGMGKSYTEAYSQAMSNVPLDATVYQKAVLKAATKNDNWMITLLWRMN